MKNELMCVNLPQTVEVIPQNNSLIFFHEDAKLKNEFYDLVSNIRSLREKISDISLSIDRAERKKRKKKIMVKIKPLIIKRDNHKKIMATYFNHFVNKYNAEEELKIAIEKRSIRNKKLRFTKLSRDKTLNKEFKNFCKEKSKQLELECNAKNFIPIKCNLGDIKSVLKICGIPYQKYFIVDEEKTTVNYKISSLIENYLTNHEILEEYKEELLIFVDIIKWIFSEIDFKDKRNYDQKMNDYIKFLIEITERTEKFINTHHNNNRVNQK